MSASSSSSAAEGRRLSKGFTSQLDSSSSPAALAQQEHDEDRPSIDMSTTRVDRGMDVGPGPLLIEVSNEVCRKSGGIYTVLQVHTIERERERESGEKKKKKNNSLFLFFCCFEFAEQGSSDKSSMGQSLCSDWRL
jgi:hypothetical protein